MSSRAGRLACGEGKNSGAGVAGSVLSCPSGPLEARVHCTLRLSFRESPGFHSHGLATPPSQGALDPMRLVLAALPGQIPRFLLLGRERLPYSRCFSNLIAITFYSYLLSFGRAFHIALAGLELAP